MASTLAILAAQAALVSAVAAAAAPERAPAPHILMMLVDDWGWADVGFHREKPTPEVEIAHIAQKSFL